MVIYTIGIGADVMLQQTLFGVRQFDPSQDLDENALRQIADTTGGRYFRARDVAEFAEIYDELDRLEPAETDEAGFRPVTEYFFWPLSASVLLALAGTIFAALPRWKGRAPVKNG